MVAVLAGVGVYVGGMVVAGVIIATLWEAAIVQVTAGSLTLAIAGIAIGAVFSFLGGYVCVRMAQRNERRVAVITAALIIAGRFALGFVAASMLERSPAWGIWTMIQVASILLFAMAGGELGRRRNVAQAREAGIATAA